MSLTFEEAVQGLESKPARSEVMPVRITAHSEEGNVLYGYGGLLYEAPEPRFHYVSGGDLMLSQPDSYAFEGGRLTTEGQLTNARVRLLDNGAYDTKSPDEWGFHPHIRRFSSHNSSSLPSKLGGHRSIETSHIVASYFG
jgi:hypothetical protein